jgi:hypothetical protein
MASPIPIDPALQAEDSAYQASLSGIYPSQGNVRPHFQGSGSTPDEADTPAAGASGGKKKKQKVDDEEARQKKSRQSREYFPLVQQKCTELT